MDVSGSRSLFFPFFCIIRNFDSCHPSRWESRKKLPIFRPMSRIPRRECLWFNDLLCVVILIFVCFQFFYETTPFVQGWRVDILGVWIVSKKQDIEYWSTIEIYQSTLRENQTGKGNIIIFKKSASVFPMENTQPLARQWSIVSLALV